MKCTVCDGSGRTPSPTGVPMIGATSCAGCFGTGCRPAPSTPGEGTGRPGGWVEGIGWVALFHDLPEGTRFLSHSASEPPITSIVGVMCSPDDWENYPVIVTRWADGTTPAPPASPVPPTRPGADAVIRALIAACPSYGRGEGDTFRIEESAVVRLAREFLAAAPPTPTPCPYIVTGGEGTSYCSLAERSAMHAAVPPTPTPQADGPRIWVDSEGDLIVGESAGPTIGHRLGRTMVVYRDYGITDDEAIAALTRPAPPSKPADPRPTDPTGSEA